MEVREISKYLDFPTTIKTGLVLAGTCINWLVGGYDLPIIILVTVMIFDYVTGVVKGVINNKLSSEIGFKGILKKSMVFIVLILAVQLDHLINANSFVFRTMVAYFYIANEGLSILENLGEIGVDYPQQIQTVLKQLKDKEGNDGQ